VRVERVGGLELEHAGDLGRRERRHDHLVGTLVEGPVVAAERLHHGQVGTDADEEQSVPGQDPVEDGLERAFERRVLSDDVGELVEDDDAAGVRRRAGEQSKRCVPACHGEVAEGVRAGEVGAGDLVDEELELLVQGASRSSVEEVGHPGSLDELLDETGLAHATPSSDEDGLAGLRVRRLAHRREAVGELPQLLLSSHEHVPRLWSGSDSPRRLS
jgi:hypothetical protein